MEFSCCKALVPRLCAFEARSSVRAAFEDALVSSFFFSRSSLQSFARRPSRSAGGGMHAQGRTSSARCAQVRCNLKPSAMHAEGGETRRARVAHKGGATRRTVPDASAHLRCTTRATLRYGASRRRRQCFLSARNASPRRAAQRPQKPSSLRLRTQQRLELWCVRPHTRFPLSENYKRRISQPSPNPRPHPAVISSSTRTPSPLPQF